jgi:hypothetical protein
VQSSPTVAGLRHLSPFGCAAGLALAEQAYGERGELIDAAAPSAQATGGAPR